MSDAYKGFARRAFPNARRVADKFHVLRLLNPALTQRRVEITGDLRSMAIRRLLLRGEMSVPVHPLPEMLSCTTPERYGTLVAGGPRAPGSSLGARGEH